MKNDRNSLGIHDMGLQAFLENACLVKMHYQFNFSKTLKKINKNFATLTLNFMYHIVPKNGFHRHNIIIVFYKKYSALILIIN